MIKQFINKIIKQYSEHFKKGNLTLGTLPNDWELELEEMLKDAFKAARMDKYKDVPFEHNEYLYESSTDYIESLNVE